MSAHHQDNVSTEKLKLLMNTNKNMEQHWAQASHYDQLEHMVTNLLAEEHCS